MSHSNPDYYAKKKPEPIEVIRAWNLNWEEGNILKYLARWREKDGVKDLKKLIRYAELLIKEVESAENISD